MISKALPRFAEMILTDLRQVGLGIYGGRSHEIIRTYFAMKR